MRNFYFKKSEFNEGIEVCMRALRLYEEFLPNDDEKIAKLYYNIGKTCKKTNYKNKRSIFYEKALSIFKKSMDKYANKVLQIYILLGEMYKTKNCEKREAFYMDALNVSKEYPNIKNIVLFTVYYE